MLQKLTQGGSELKSFCLFVLREKKKKKNSMFLSSQELSRREEEKYIMQEIEGRFVGAIFLNR